MLALLFTSLFACSRLDENTFITQYSNQYCSNIFSCVAEEDLETIGDFYGSETECASEMETEIATNLSNSTLVYDGQAAKECIDALAALECDAPPEDYDICNSVYIAEE